MDPADLQFALLPLRVMAAQVRDWANEDGESLVCSAAPGASSGPTSNPFGLGLDSGTNSASRPAGPGSDKPYVSYVYGLYRPTGTNFAPALQVLQVDRYRPNRYKLEFDLSRAPHGAQPIETDARSTSPSSQQPIDKGGQHVRGHRIARCLQVCVSH